MTEWVVTPKSVTVEAGTPEEAVVLAVERWGRAHLNDVETMPESEIAEALKFYADPMSYFAITVWPDRPSGPFADDVGCCVSDMHAHDHRHGRLARRALGDEWGGTEPCDEMLKVLKEESEQ